MKRIAIIIEGRVAYERQVLLGIREFASNRPDWIIRLVLPGRHVEKFLDDWQPEGTLFQATGLTPETLCILSENSQPAIHVSDSRRSVDAPCVGLDNEAIGRAAAEFFRERNFRCHAFAGVKDAGFSHSRGESFESALNVRVQKLDLPPDFRNMSPAELMQAGQWLLALPKPAALFAAHDECSLQITTLCQEVGIRVPEDLALLGADDDSLVCELAWPKLSSIAVPARKVGWTAASRLDEWLQTGKPPGPPESILLPPLGVISRQSTDIDRTEDETVNRALRIIAARFQHRVNIEDVLKEAGVSRRDLERRFQQQIGRSPLTELHRTRVEYAKYHLLGSNAPLTKIADHCGFASASQLISIFRKQTGQTPGQFRSTHSGI